MKHSRLASRLKRNHARYRGRNDLNIVPMLDIMVILAFFLIFTAVFSRTSILEVQLPGPKASATRADPPLDLEVVLRGDGRTTVGDRRGTLLQALPAAADGRPDFERLSGVLAALKQQHPELANATLLVEQDVAYDTIVQVMDTVRVRQATEGGQVRRTELFPQIALGDAPQ
jgi:biopolymer transport protein ExbD